MVILRMRSRFLIAKAIEILAWELRAVLRMATLRMRSRFLIAKAIEILA